MADDCCEVITEHALGARTGDMLIRYEDPEGEAIYPLNDWIRDSVRFRRRVFRRRIIVVEDWQEVTIPGVTEIKGIGGTRPDDSADE